MVPPRMRGDRHRRVREPSTSQVEKWIVLRSKEGCSGRRSGLRTYEMVRTHLKIDRSVLKDIPKRKVPWCRCESPQMPGDRFADRPGMRSLYPSQG